MLHAGIDIGSKTIKLVIYDDEWNLVYDSYDRHLSNVKDTLAYVVGNAARLHPHDEMTLGMTGSAGMQISETLGLAFTQEVVAAHVALKRLIPDADVAIEIGGEDSKIMFLTGGEEMRMNSTCAGGTGGFIDTIAGMLDINAAELNVYALGCTQVYPIASRCAVFAQSDVRPLINEGVSKEDIAGSTFDAVVTQCITGLSCGREIKGKVALLGGPLHFLSSLRERFRIRLGLQEGDLRVPSEGHLFVATGAAMAACEGGAGAGSVVTLSALAASIESFSWEEGALLQRLEPLFRTKDELRAFREQHARVDAPRGAILSYEGPVYLGVDSGSEAIKFVLIGEEGQVLRTYYQRSAGNLVDAANEMFKSLWKYMPLDFDGSYAAHIAHATVTGYGEGFLKAAYSFDSGEVETVAHVRAAQELVPDADFIFDIGGQDMKCIRLRNGEVDSVVLNEACSSGCGALLSGMAWSMNVRQDRFVERALFAEQPVDLGTRCTVFMTSRVRHAQKEGASVGDLSAGLAYSVVRNALYKVIRVRDVSELGEKIVVQGGTFANDAVLRAFENMLGREVIRPEIAPYMGAYGAALLARDRAKGEDVSSLISKERAEGLVVRRSSCVCEGCANACSLLRTTFEDEGRTRVFTVGNRCERGESAGLSPEEAARLEGVRPAVGVNLFEKRRRRLFSYRPRTADDAPRGSIGIVRALDTYETYPFWFTFFDTLGFRVELSRQVRSTLRGKALETIPSESLCYPAKLAHGGVVDLVERGQKLLFLPYVESLDGSRRACPVTAGYPLVLESNIDLMEREGARAVSPVLPRLLAGTGVSSPADSALVAVLADAFAEAGVQLDGAEVEQALAAAARELHAFRRDVAEMGREALAAVAAEGGRAVVCAGRPYHGDPAVHHAIPDLLASYGYAVLTEDAVANPDEAAGEELDVDEAQLTGNWEYAERAVRAARVVARTEGLEMVQLYSFGCGLDAVTVDRVRDILEAAGKSLTALKIDEMVDLAATRIRIRSMMAAQEGLIGKGAACRRSGGQEQRRPAGTMYGAWAPSSKLVLYDESKHAKRGKLSVWREFRDKSEKTY